LGKFYAGVIEDLTLYARQLAWFSAKPKHPERPGSVSSRIKVADKTRGQEIVDRGGTPLMPDVGDAAYLVAYWQQMGMVEQGGMGMAPMSSRELAAWCSGAGIDLQPWEFHALREMSKQYLVQLNESEKPECPPPYGDPATVFDRNVVSKKVTQAFQAFMQARSK